MLGWGCVCTPAKPAVCAGGDTQVRAGLSRVIGGDEEEGQRWGGAQRARLHGEGEIGGGGVGWVEQGGGMVCPSGH